MTRFVFLTDTHLGASPMGFQQQQGYPERLAELVASLDAWIAAQGDIEFCLHGGDLLDRCRPDLIRRAKATLRFSVPFYACLGNHDLTDPDAAGWWSALAPEWFAGPDPQFEIERPDVVIHVAPNHWENRDYVWEDRQEPALRDAQIARIRQHVAAYSDRLHILCTHSPVFGIPSEQTGCDGEMHDPGAAFRDAIVDLLDPYPQICCVLGGHNHVNTLSRYRRALAVTCSSFVETPFEFKVVQVDGQNLSVRTHNLAESVAFGPGYDYERTFVQGRACDRHASVVARLKP